MDFSQTKIRCSAIGEIMTPPKSKEAKEAGLLGETATKYLKQLFRELRYGRKKEFTSKYTDKGLMVEEDSITLYSRLKKKVFKKNEQRLENDFICGTPDLFEGESITRATNVIDTKSSWDLFTFPFPNDKQNTDYYWQLQGYMALTGARSAVLAYCLIDTPLTLINDEKRKLFYKMNAGTEENPDYVAACEELERRMMFGDIPMSERMVEFPVERNDSDIELIYAQVKKARNFLIGLDASYLLAPKQISRNGNGAAKKIQLDEIPLIKL